MPDYDSRQANPFPFPIASEVEAAPGTREQKAARNVIARHVQGIPRRAILLGDNDHAPIPRGVLDLVAAVYELLDWVATDEDSPSGEIQAKAAVVKILNHHGCPDEREVPGT